MSVHVYRSSDTNAPKVGGWAGALTDLLLACLVNGYGSSFATATITSNGTNVSNNDTVTIDGVTYTFKTALTPAANEVLIGASAAASLANLAAAVDLQGTSGTTYGASTQTPPGAYVSNVSATILTVRARRGGTTGNSVAIAKSAATLTLSGATLSGGSGSDATTSAGWLNPYNGNGGQRVFQSASGLQHFYHVDDASPHTTALAKEAQFRGSETASAFQTVTGYFPTTAQVALGSGLVARKSAALDQTERAWIVIADGRTAYVFVQTGDIAGTYYAFMIGEIYSVGQNVDSYRSAVIGRATPNSAAATTSVDNFATCSALGGTTLAGHYLARTYSGAGTALAASKTFSPVGQTAASTLNGGVLNGAEANTGAILLFPVWSIEVSAAVRGRYRGMFGALQGTGTFGDADSVAGDGAYTGRTFLAVKALIGNGASVVTGFFDITGDWETN